MRSTLDLTIDRHPALVLSDVHLGAHTALQEQLLYQHLRSLMNSSVEKNAQLIFLGDLFDYWLEAGKRFPPAFRDWLKMFESYHAKAPSIYLVTGNHDHWAGQVLENAGFTLVNDYLRITNKTHSYILFHGDGLLSPTMEMTRQGLNAKFRAPWWNDLFNHILPFDARVWLMRSFSSYRRSRFHEEDERIFLRTYFWQWLEQSEFDVAVYGHTHLRFLIQKNQKTLINLGEMITDSYLLNIEESQHTLTEHSLT